MGNSHPSSPPPCGAVSAATAYAPHPHSTVRCSFTSTAPIASFSTYELSDSVMRLAFAKPGMLFYSSFHANLRHRLPRLRLLFAVTTLIVAIYAVDRSHEMNGLDTANIVTELAPLDPTRRRPSTTRDSTHDFWPHASCDKKDNAPLLAPALHNIHT